MANAALSALLLAVLAAPAGSALATAPAALPASDLATSETAPLDVTRALAGLPADAPAAVAEEAIAAALAQGALALPDAPVPGRALPSPAPKWSALEFGPLGEDLPAPVVRVPEVALAPPPLAAPALAALPVAIPERVAPVARVAPAEVAVAAAGSAALSLLPVLFGRFYTRLAPGDALLHPVRRRLHEIVTAEPGIHMAALAERLGVANGQLVYHLDVLRRERLVARVDSAGAARLFAAGTLAPQEMRQRAAMMSGSSERIATVVRERPGVTMREVADAVGLSVPAVHRALEKLESAGVVERRRVGRAHAVYPLAA